jgi:hypothetical protein
MTKGVYLNKTYISRPYEIKKRIDKKNISVYFPTKEDAVQALKAYKKEREDEKRKKRDALATKRASDMSKYGDNSNMERRIAVQLVEEWKNLTGRRAFVLNDGTRGDILFEREDARFLVVQLKTTHQKIAFHNGYMFANVLGYSEMPVLCFCEKDSTGWVADGSLLEAKNKRHLYITPGSKSESGTTLAKGCMHDLLSFLNIHADMWKPFTEYDARHDFNSESNSKEMRGIDAFKNRFPELNYEWPDEQNGHTDQLVDSKRHQFKNARVLRGRNGWRGLCVGICTKGGKDESGKQLKDPYPHDSFDFLTITWEEEPDKWHFWSIPAEELTTRGYLSTSSQSGKKGLYVYGPVGPQPNPSAKLKADTWTRDYFLSE